LSKFEDKIMRISSTDVIEGSHVLYTIGKIKAASSWHAANGAPPQDNWRELVVSELIRKAEDIDADAIISFDYETDSIVPIEGTGLQTQAHSRHRGRCQACLRSVVHGLRKVADFSVKIIHRSKQTRMSLSI
jgi:uncharacterized protein YbjQ (UPF0145 family)